MNLADYLTEAPWKEQAACRDLDYRIFFPTQGGSTRQAKAICAGCRVRTECLDEALNRRSHYDFGVWGGLTERERQVLRKGRAA